MNRTSILKQLETTDQWDFIIIGGGATGLGTAVDAASRGYKTLLVEQYDFAKGTSSRSTKLVHGGVRYLAQGNIKLVFEALHERGLLVKNAPHVVNKLPFVVPFYNRWQKFYYGAGLKFYDLLSASLHIGKTSFLSKKKTLELLPNIDAEKLVGSILYYDGQFDDSRLAIDLAVTANEQGAVTVNYCKLVGFIKTDNKISGVELQDTITGKRYRTSSKVVINASGVFTDEVLKLDDQQQHDIIAASQGIHLVIDKKFFPGNHALMIPKTDDGRVLFCIPWQDHIIVGTTDTPVEHIAAEPVALEEEISFLVDHLNRYLQTDINRADIKSVFTGLRPLVRIKGKKKTAIMPRDHTILVSASGLISITGGKWTTYRRMAQDVTDKAIRVKKLPFRPCVTASLKIHGWNSHAEDMLLQSILQEDPAWKEKIHSSFSYTRADIIKAIRYEMAITLEDVLARRTRLLFLDVKAAIEVAPAVAAVMAKEMNKDEIWQQEQLELFNKVASHFRVQGS